LQFFPHEKPYGYFLTFIEDPFFAVVHVSRKILRDTFRSSENPLQLIALEILPAYIMVNSIWLIVFVDLPCPCHFKPMDSMCAYARDHQDILLNYLSDSDVLPDMSWFSAT
jgi:hypothetical protein